MMLMDAYIILEPGPLSFFGGNWILPLKTPTARVLRFGSSDASTLKSQGTSWLTEEPENRAYSVPQPWSELIGTSSLPACEQA